MKKLTSLLLATLITLTLIPGCSTETEPAPEPMSTPEYAEPTPEEQETPNTGEQQETETQIQQASINIVCTAYPQYDWTREIIYKSPADITLTLLFDDGTDWHSYQPTAQDIEEVKTADMLIYVGGETDRWAENAIDNPDMIALSLIDVLDDDNPDTDEHVWLSLHNAAFFVNEICDAITALDTYNADIYSENADDYIAMLTELDRQYHKTIENAPIKTLLFADRFPFRYLAEDYGIECYAALSGCSNEDEADNDTIMLLAGIADELNLPAIMVTEESEETIAKAVIRNMQTGDPRIIKLNSMQTMTAFEVEQLPYFKYMQINLINLNIALGLA